MLIWVETNFNTSTLSMKQQTVMANSSTCSCWKLNKLICLNTRYQKRTGKRWTHTNPNGSKAQLDYLLINKKWINSCINCEPYNSFCGVSSDHRIVSCNLRLSLRKNKTKNTTKPPYDWSLLAKNQVVKDAYTIKLYNRFNSLQESEENPSTNSTYQNFIESHLAAAKKYIPHRPKLKRKAPWENEIIKAKRDTLKDLTKQAAKYTTCQRKRIKEQAWKELNQAYLEEQQKYIQDQIDKINNSVINQQSSLAWKTINCISGRKKSPKSKLKAKTQVERLEL